MPPMPEPITTPMRLRSSFSRSMPASAWRAAHMARCTVRSVRLLSLRSMNSEASKLRTSQPKRVGYALMSKAVMLAAPLFPATIPFQVPALLLPSAVTRPTPVITTRRFEFAINAAARRVPRGPQRHAMNAAVLTCLGGDVIDRVLHGLDLLGFLVRNIQTEFVFERHDELDGVERVRLQILGESGAVGDLVRIHGQLLFDDLLYLGFDLRHEVLLLVGRSPRSARRNHTAITVDDLPRNVGRCIRNQEHHHIGHVHGLSETAQRNNPVSYTHLRAHETPEHLVCR